MDLSTFLLARLDEDEQVARATNDQPARRYSWDARQVRGHTTIALTGSIYELAEDVVESVAEHIARHDPARVLAEVEAKRAIVGIHTGHHECVSWQRHSTVLEPDPDSPLRTDTVLVDKGYIHENDPTLRLLALPYADHPDYRAEWKPNS